MVEEGKKKLSKATKEYTKFKANYERFGNNVTCKLLDYWFGATNPLNGN
jgi:hypothetical protein